tara:strand:- start:88 stop:528 length:441 start_codon:yes stop_codon:yes gene_type:complete
MIRLSMSEVLSELPKKKTKAEKIEWLRKNENVPFRNVLRLIYDETIEFLLPDSAPPWKENKLEDEAKTMLYREARRLKIFIKGGGYDDMKPIKRESLFIKLLEDIDNEDAELLANNMLSHTRVKGLTRATLEEAYPNLFTTPMDMR